MTLWIVEKRYGGALTLPRKISENLLDICPIGAAKTMPQTIMTNALAFSDLRFDSPTEIIDELHTKVARRAGLNVFGAWPKYLNPFQAEDYEPNRNMFFHSSVSKSFLESYFRDLPAHRPTPTQRLAWHGTGPFTFTECTRIMQPTGRDRWIFDLLSKHGMRDGLYCPTNRWMVVYWSKKRVMISEQMRNALSFAAFQAGASLTQMIPKPKRLAKWQKLTRREYDVLYGLSMGQRPQEIADKLGIKVATVRNQIVLAQLKLGAKTPTQAVAEAYRRALVK